VELKKNVLTSGEAGDEAIQQILREILLGLKAKMVQPLLEENQKISGRIEELKAQERTSTEGLLARLGEIENRLGQMPLLILSSIRDAINQASGGSADD